MFHSARRHSKWRTGMQVTSRSPTRKNQVGPPLSVPWVGCSPLAMSSPHPWHYISDSSSSSWSRGFTNQANTSQTPPPFALLGNHGQCLPSRPSSFGKQFGQDHTRGNFQKSLLVKQPASALFFLPHHQLATPLLRPSAGNVPSVSTPIVKIHALSACHLHLGISPTSQMQEPTCTAQRFSNVSRLDFSCSGFISSSPTAILTQPAAMPGD